ncbi:MAG: rhodanese-related sulfurtransferase [Sediminibacterium sp.]|nr:rhodanese-related sulfurtransferase [Sediminibacterium sp.]
MVFHNKRNKKELKTLVEQENFNRTTISFYRYVNINDPISFRNFLYQNLNELQVFGRIYIATEGINAQISVPEFNLEKCKQFIHSLPELNNIRLNIAVEENRNSFWVLSCKVRPKIVADGIVDKEFNPQNTGNYVNAAEMNDLINNPQAVIVDMRNHYEYEVGHFKNAIEIPADTFKDQLKIAVEKLDQHKKQPVIMYCTGGIRCEKASSYLKHNGFEFVYHLEGGIINYVNQVKDQNLPCNFIGKNFVFDNRLGERVTPDIIATCHQCGKPCDNHINCANEGCHLLFIQCSDCAQKFNNCCSEQCQSIIFQPPEIQYQLRKGKNLGQHIFNKSRQRMLNLKKS